MLPIKENPLDDVVDVAAENAIDKQKEIELVANIINNASVETLEHICSLLPIEVVQNRITREIKNALGLKEKIQRITKTYVS